MLNLKDTTFIIPVRIESRDREFNFRHVIRYLCEHFETTIIIKESDENSRVKDLLWNFDRIKTTIIHEFEQSNDPAFHRTRLLNEMLHKVKTPVTANYDIDVLMDPDVYIKAQHEILHHGADLVYPYFKGESQMMMKHNGNGSLEEDFVLHGSVCGHCQFFRTSAYREGGMENENFISYGPEDSERMHRFQMLGYKVLWLDNYIMHIEHSRTENSSDKNPLFRANDHLYKKLIAMPEPELRQYYKQQQYLNKYV